MNNKFRRPTKEDPLDLLMRALLGGDRSGAIQDEEREGQYSFVESDTLPTEMSVEDKEYLTKEGVVFHGIVPEDTLFQYVTLPEGWKKDGTEHDMWSVLVDQHGIEVAKIFYKAAAYDRRAHLHVVNK